MPIIEVKEVTFKLYEIVMGKELQGWIFASHGRSGVDQETNRFFSKPSIMTAQSRVGNFKFENVNEFVISGSFVSAE